MTVDSLPKHWNTDGESQGGLVQLPVTWSEAPALVKTLLTQGRTKEEVSSLLEDPAEYNLNKGKGYCPTGHFLTASDEADFVISHVKETGLGQDVRGLERIQNATVWRTYAARRKELLPEGWREVLMFHGTAKQSIASIAKTGFLTALGAGTLFFARASSTSLGYIQKPNGPVAPIQTSAQEMTAEPSFITDGHAMLLCRVLVSPDMLSSQRIAHHVDINVIVTINSNELAYPEWIIHF